MQGAAGHATVHHSERGSGMPVLVLHGAGVDHREAEACFEPALSTGAGYRRIYPDLPGMGATPAPPRLRSADDVLETLVGFVDTLLGDEPFLLAGHSVGGYYAQGIAALRPKQVAGLALVCPFTSGVRDVPEHRPVATEVVGEDDFRAYFVVQTGAMLDRYRRFVAPGMRLADEAAMGRIGERWTLTALKDWTYDGPALVVAGRLDSTVGSAAAIDLAAGLPRCTLAVLDRAGHALPHEQPELFAALLLDWLDRVDVIRGVQSRRHPSETR